MENDHNLENVINVNDGGAQQYLIQRVGPDNSQLLNTELLQSHSGLVVDLGSGDFIPVNYNSEDLLSQDLTEEDRNLAAALVAVQFSQQHKQQQQDSNTTGATTSLPTLMSSNSIGKHMTVVCLEI